jgi:hypothetical protein
MAKTDVFRAAILDGESRSVKTTKIDVIDVPPYKGSSVGLGMMIAIIANKETKILTRLRSLLQGGEQGAKDANEILSKTTTKKAPATSQEYVEMLIRQPVYADIRYGGETLNKGLFLPPGVDVITSVFPYNGGRLAPEGFSLVERFRDESKAGLEALIMRSAPNLTESEKTALLSVPSDQLVNNVGVASWCDTTWWAAAVVALALAFPAATAAAATTLLMSKGESAFNENLPDKEIQKLGPAASARSLLALRRKLIEQHVA